jgi:hypothetical protein
MRLQKRRRNAMKAAALSVGWFGAYLALAGMLLLVWPETTCEAIGLRPPGETMWPRLVGALLLDLAFYCLHAACRQDEAFIRRTVVTRPWTIVLLSGLIGFGLENPIVLVFGLIDLAAAIWTYRALRGRH